MTRVNMMPFGMREAVSDAIAIRGGVRIQGQPERAAEQFRGIGLQELAHVCLRHEGQAVGYLAPDQLFQRAISTGSFAEILGTSATKVLMQAYQEYPSTFAQWAGTRDVADLKVYNDIKLGAFASLAEVGDGGEIKHGTLSEAKETHQAKTYGRRFAVTRKMWMNDDLGAFLRIPGQLGAAAMRNIDDLGYALLYSASGVGPTLNEDSKALFSTTHAVANYHTGAGSALGDAGLTAGKVLMRKVVGLASELINVIPRVLLVPAALEHTALKLVQSQEIMLAKAGSTDATTYLPTANVHRGTLRVIVEPRLDGATNGATAWYLIANPTQVESLVIVFLRGQRNPTIERKDPTDVLGIGWWMYHDVGVAAVDWRGINRGKGV